MSFNVYIPDGEGPFPVLYALAGRGGNEDSIAYKSGFEQHVGQILIVFPDTSPRGLETGENGYPEDGYSTSYYVNATAEPWSKHFQMYTYIVEELPSLIKTMFSVSDCQSIMGHSMGGCGALLIAAKEGHKYKSVSAIAPRCSPSNPGAMWAKKAYDWLFGNDLEAQKNADPVEVIRKGCVLPPGLVDIGTADDMQLQPELLIEAL